MEHHHPDPAAVSEMMGGFLNWVSAEILELKKWKGHAEGTVFEDVRLLSGKLSDTAAANARLRGALGRLQTRVLEDKVSYAARRLGYNILLQHSRAAAGRKKRSAHSRSTALALQGRTHRAVAARVYAAWARWSAGIRRKKNARRQAEKTLTERTEYRTRREAWRRLAALRAGIKARHDAVNSRADGQARRLAARYLAKLSRFVAVARRRRKAVTSLWGIRRRADAVHLADGYRKLQKHVGVTITRRSSELAESRKSRLRNRTSEELLQKTNKRVLQAGYRAWAHFGGQTRTRTSKESFYEVNRAIEKCRRELTDRLSEHIALQTQALREEDAKKTEMIRSVEFDVQEVQRMMLSYGEQQKMILDSGAAITDQAERSLRAAMAEVDSVLASTKDEVRNRLELVDAAMHALSTTVSASLATQDAQVRTLLSDSMSTLEKTMADLLSDDREKMTEAIDHKLDAVTGRYAALNQQVEVSLQSLSNTNTVLNKVVDRVMSVEAEIEVLDRSKVSKRELNSVRTDRTQSPSRSSMPLPHQVIPETMQPKEVSPSRHPSPVMERQLSSSGASDVRSRLMSRILERHT
ncbi:hypothetical protein DIPPA_16395 [Diplonema papillatum]|nr:hypothetical protein DIPPA_16395 [Diplonema papillatum]KAJ9468708.1 hypothetical protein DIPPA_16395 [Diplonema papillatum]